MTVDPRLAVVGTGQTQDDGGSAETSKPRSTKARYKVVSAAKTSNVAASRPPKSGSATGLRHIERGYKIHSSAETFSSQEAQALRLVQMESDLYRLASLALWKDADHEALVELTEKFLQEDRLAPATSIEETYGYLLWKTIVNFSNNRLRWEFLAALRDIGSAEAIALESYLARILVHSRSAGDRLAAIKSLLRRSPTVARAELLKLKATETIPSVVSAIDAYLSSMPDDKHVPKTAE